MFVVLLLKICINYKRNSSYLIAKIKKSYLLSEDLYLLILCIGMGNKLNIYNQFKYAKT